MKYKILFLCTVCISFITCLLVFPSTASQGVISGMKICFNIVIPSLFPFTIAALMFSSVEFSQKKNKNIFQYFFNRKVVIFIFSNLGGYAVGAKLIDDEYKKGNIDHKTAELMLGYCVNSGPAFIILAVGCGIWNNKQLGILLYLSSVISSLLIAITTGSLIKEKKGFEQKEYRYTSFSDNFTNSTYEATKAMVRICGTVTIFTTIIELIKPLLINIPLNNSILSMLEITNGMILSYKNVYFSAFLLGFAGLSVHFQVLSLCRSVKPNYIRFLFFRIVHGILSATVLSAFLKIFKIKIQTINLNGSLCYEFSKYSMLFSGMLILCSIIFMISVSKSYNLE